MDREILTISFCEKNPTFYQGNVMAVVRMIEMEKMTRAFEGGWSSAPDTYLSFNSRIMS